MERYLTSTECIRTIVSTRLQTLGLTSLHLPLTSGPTDPRVPILVSRNLSTASRIVVVFGEPIQDLGVWAYRSVGTDGINAGSAVSLAEALLGRSPTQGESGQTDGQNGDKSEANGNKPSGGESATALILANTGQLIWHCAARRCVTHPTWVALPRRSAVDPPVSMSTRNDVPRNATWQEHVECVFEDVLAARGRLVREDTRIDVIGLAEGGLGAVRYLGEKCTSPSSPPYLLSWLACRFFFW